MAGGDGRVVILPDESVIQQAADSMVNRQRIMVTGGTGFIGSHLALSLLSSGESCAVMTRNSGIVRTRLGCLVVKADLRDPEALHDALCGYRPDVVIHLASWPDAEESHQQARECLQNNAMGTLNLLEAMRASGCQRILYGDSTKVFGDIEGSCHGNLPAHPISSYAISKLCGWKLCKLYQRLHGFRVVSIRPTLVYGPGQPHNLISYVSGRILEGASNISLQGGSQTRAPLYIDDAVAAYLAAMQRLDELSGRVIAIGGGLEISVFEIASMIVDIMGSDAKLCVETDNIRATDTRRSCCDNEYAAGLLGWRPRISLHEGLQRTLADQFNVRRDSYVTGT